MGGKVNRLGNGRGYPQPPRPGSLGPRSRAARRVPAGRVARGAHEQRKALLLALITVSRESRPTEQEDLILGRALEILYDRHEGVPLVADLDRLIADAPEDLLTVVLNRGDMDRYLDATDALRTSLIGIATGSGPLGDMFSRHTTEQLDIDRSVVFDLSALPDTQPQKQAAGLLACWSIGFEAVNTAQVLADAGLEPRRNYNIVLDEFWRALRVGRGIVDKADSLTRLNRNDGVGRMMISHTLKDFEAVADEAARVKAPGIPVQMKLTTVEDDISDTNTRWENLRKQGASTEEIEREIFGHDHEDYPDVQDAHTAEAGL